MLEETCTRNSRDRISPGSSQDPFTSQCAALHPSYRSDTDDVKVGMPFTKEEAVFEEYGRSWSSHVAPNESECCSWWDEQQFHPSRAGREIWWLHKRTSGHYRTLQLCRSRSPITSNTFANHSEVQLQENTATVLRVSGDFTAYACKQ